MDTIVGGRRKKGIFKVVKGQSGKDGSFHEYQLEDNVTGKSYKNGTWIRERELSKES